MQTPTQDETLVPFPLLTDRATYRACHWDLLEHDTRRGYWLKLFRGHWPRVAAAYRAEAMDRGEDEAVIAANVAAAQRAFIAHLDTLDKSPASLGKLTILSVCYAREEALRGAKIADPYRLAKHTDTEHALAVLPALLGELDAMGEAERRVALVLGIFAGNIYDLGATETVAMFTDQRVDFHAVRARLKPRPWLFDDLDAWLRRLDGPAHRAAVLFVDNAGPDVTLGMLPFARFLLLRGTRVILTANTHPSLNDVTHDELVALMGRITVLDAVLREALADGRLMLVPSGNNAPLIDLTRVSRELAEAVAREGVDLVVLEGMGRAVESNLDAELTCDTLKLAMVKDGGVAEALGGALFDLVMRFEPGTRTGR